MAMEFMLPDLGENVASGTVAEILVSVGDRIEEGQTVLELETDKAILPVPSTVTGTVQEIAVKIGDKIAVGQKVFVMGEGGDAAGAGSAPAEQAGSGEGDGAPTRGEASPDGQVAAGVSSAAVEPAAQNRGMGSAMDTP